MVKCFLFQYWYHQDKKSIEEICDSEVSNPNPSNFTFTPRSVPYDKSSVEIKVVSNNFLVKEFLAWGSRVRITVAGIKCEWSQTKGISIICKNDLKKLSHGRLLFQYLRKSVISTSDFQFVNPSIDNFKPKTGPISGGTLVTITGRHLNVGNLTKVFICMSCDITSLSEDQVVCRTKSCSDGSFHLRMNIYGVNRKFDQETFKFVTDPSVNSVASDPFNKTTLKGIPAGGSKIFVNGSNFLSIQKPQFYVYNGKLNFTSDCISKSNTQMECESPTINTNGIGLDVNKPMKLEFGFIMDHVQKVQNFSMKKRRHSKFELYPNPWFEPFPGGVKLMHVEAITNSSTIINIAGRNLDIVCRKSDVHVMIAHEECNIISFSRESLECRPPKFDGKNA